MLRGLLYYQVCVHSVDMRSLLTLCCRLLLTTVFFLCLYMPATAQKFGYIDSEIVLEQLPEYKVARQALQEQVSKWLRQIDDKKTGLNQLRDEYYAVKVLLTKSQQIGKTEEIFRTEKELQALENHVFGYKGLLFRKRLELMRLVEKRVYNAVRRVARNNRLAIMFDKSAGLLMIYSDPGYNYTEDVLALLLPKKQEKEQ